ncbi:adenosine deaminase/editase [Lasiosphaeria hispida]|uniref:Adenosine deaminase/editase n=1 Tax=Lasiosphaeria hispida TaxID=260671 RepID=A0AAJ0HV99_9PEZI|nr:adenosine deaminase/editase [Lasiosphaeria hispida]
MTQYADAIASSVLEEFRKLSAKRKPSVRDNGLHEWVPLSGIVAKGPGSLKCVALATGMKCLPASKLPQANGIAIHDSHAEVLALRTFNQFVLQECRRLTLGEQSEFLRRRTDLELAPLKKSNGQDAPWHGQPFAWRKDVTLHMYCSEAPCGDASMELIMAAQDDASPWTIPLTLSTTPAQAPDPTPLSLPGRAYFSHLGVVRRKPARGDAPPTLSKSCSDKIALKQCTSLLSSLTSLLISPHNVYLSSLVLPESQYSATACKRCFSAVAPGGRMSALVGREWTGSGYAFVPFQVETTGLEFDFSKRTVAARSDKTSASNLAVAWVRSGIEEGLIGGVMQGRKQFDLRGASAVSRRRMWGLAAEIAGLLGAGAEDGIAGVLAAGTYDEVKEGGLLEARRKVKDEAHRDALKGWLRNMGDGVFSLL